MAATNEAKRILIFDDMIVSASSKAKFAMNILIVKPMPPKKDTPKMYFQFKSPGSDAIFALTAKYETRKIPTNFPTSNPNMIPSELLLVRLLSKLFGKTIAVLASANIGRIMKATG